MSFRPLYITQRLSLVLVALAVAACDKKSPGNGSGNGDGDISGDGDGDGDTTGDGDGDTTGDGDISGDGDTTGDGDGDGDISGDGDATGDGDMSGDGDATGDGDGDTTGDGDGDISGDGDTTGDGDGGEVELPESYMTPRDEKPALGTDGLNAGLSGNVTVTQIFDQSMEVDPSFVYEVTSTSGTAQLRESHWHTGAEAEYECQQQLQSGAPTELTGDGAFYATSLGAGYSKGSLCFAVFTSDAAFAESVIRAIADALN